MSFFRSFTAVFLMISSIQKQITRTVFVNYFDVHVPELFHAFSVQLHVATRWSHRLLDPKAAPGFDVNLEAISSLLLRLRCPRIPFGSLRIFQIDRWKKTVLGYTRPKPGIHLQCFLLRLKDFAVSIHCWQ